MNKSLRVWLLIAIASLVMLMCVCSFGRNTEQITFVPPEFDVAAQPGVPDIPDQWPYGTAQLGEYELSLTTLVQLKDHDAYLYLANAPSNDVWMKVRVFDASENIIGESGLIKPNEYLEKVTLERMPKDSKIIVKVMCYEPDTYHSMGSSQVTVATIKIPK